MARPLIDVPSLFNQMPLCVSQNSCIFENYHHLLHCIALHCIALHCIALHCIALHCIALHCIALHCIALHCIALHCIALHCIALHCIALRIASKNWFYNIECTHTTRRQFLPQVMLHLPRSKQLKPHTAGVLQSS